MDDIAAGLVYGNFMKRALSALLALATVLAFQPLPLAAVRQQNLGEISGTAVIEGKPLSAITVPLRNVDTGQLAGNTTTDPRGEIKLTRPPLGHYVVATRSPNGR